MKVIYFGTPKFSADIFSYLFEKKVDVIAVVTQQDHIRNKEVIFSDVKQVALQKLNKDKIFQPQNASDPEFLQELKKLNADLFVVVAYGQILKDELLKIPKMGCINVHASILPKYRGAAPIQHSILNGDKTTGITIMKLVRKMDAGPIILQKEIPIKEDMIFSQLHDELCEISKPLLLEVLNLFEKNQVKYKEQDESKVTSAPKITKEVRQINFDNDAIKIYNQIRAFANEPGAFCIVDINGHKKELKIFKAKIASFKLKPKEVKLEKDFLAIGCKDGAIELIEVQLEGKRKMGISEFVRGHQNSLLIV